jgi:chloramphenicol-sensitive protein RarD
MQLTWGVVVGHEPTPPARWLGFALIWLALAVFTADACGGPVSIGARSNRHTGDTIE